MEHVTTAATEHTIRSTIEAILVECEDFGKRNAVPGEGLERAFRDKLKGRLLMAVMGWHEHSITVGEVFDLLLLDDRKKPVIYIETKNPCRGFSKDDITKFLGRLSTRPTLQWAFMTDGLIWRRVEVPAYLAGNEESDVTRELSELSDEDFYTLLEPLWPLSIIAMAGGGQRDPVSRSNPQAAHALTADLSDTINELTEFLSSMFTEFWLGRAGQEVHEITSTLFELWCEQSQYVGLQAAAEEIDKRLKDEKPSYPETKAALARLGLQGDDAEGAAEDIARRRLDGTLNQHAIEAALWPVYAEQRTTMCAQTAHVIASRVLVYRVGEDSGVFPRQLSGDPLKQKLELDSGLIASKPALELVEQVRQHISPLLPVVYKLGEFDWWLVSADKRGRLDTEQTRYMSRKDSEFEVHMKRLLYFMDAYDFSGVDIDVWRNVYQDYLPPERRQQLGGFYTPDELVDLVLDLGGYVPEREGLCRAAFIDPACGSGAFVARALSRLLLHLESDMPCHAELHKPRQPKWQRSRVILDRVSDTLHAIDIHPFAAFLTTVNVLFMLLAYVEDVRRQDSAYELGLMIFSADSLEDPEASLFEPEYFAKVNSRVQQAQESLDLFRETMGRDFAFVIGNPPWGGLLKGKLAPVHEAEKKRRLKAHYPISSTGKWDVYGVFIERALSFLSDEGTLAFVTQDSYLQKEWAASLRKLLATKTTLTHIVNLNPFGQLFFHAMNTPCVTATSKRAPSEGAVLPWVVFRALPDDAGTSLTERRLRVVDAAERLSLQASQGVQSSAGYAECGTTPIDTLAKEARAGWSFSASAPARPKTAEDAYPASDLLESHQGITPGGQGCLVKYVLDPKLVDELGIEPEVVHAVAKGQDVTKWRLSDSGRRLLYPYITRSGSSVPAFWLKGETDIETQRRRLLVSAGIHDGLNFDRPADGREAELVRKAGGVEAAVKDLLRHRLGLGVVRFPQAAEYLVENYSLFQGREFKGRNIRDFGHKGEQKLWYEYIWPRDAAIMHSRPKIVSPRLCRSTRFALDTDGVVPQDSCICLTPRLSGHARSTSMWVGFQRDMKTALGRDASPDELLLYCLAFLNSSESDALLTSQNPTPKGSFPISDLFQSKLRVPRPAADFAPKVVDLARRLTRKNAARRGDLEQQLDAVLQRSRKPTS